MKANCECCINYDYDDEYECYYCLIKLDEDEMSMFLRNSFDNCPYFSFNNEYSIVNKQI